MVQQVEMVRPGHSLGKTYQYLLRCDHQGCTLTLTK